MNYRYVALGLVFSVVIVAHNYCMEMNSVAHSHQRKIVLQLDEKFSMETWKFFGSEALHSDYLRRQQSCGTVKNIVPLYCDVTAQEMKLYSDAKDVEPTFFNKYFYSLTPAHQHMLIVLAGPQDEDPKKKKLNDSDLSAQLLEAYCGKELVDFHIKPEIERILWRRHCRNGLLVKSCHWTVPVFLLPESIYRSNDDGLLNEVPSCVGAAGSYVGPISAMHKKINDSYFVSFASKKLDDNYDYCLTWPTLKDKYAVKIPNSYLLWLVDRHGSSKGQPLCIQHKSSVKPPMFSKKGDFLLSLSKKDIILSKITRKFDSLLHTFLPIDFSDYINSYCFNDQSTALVLSSCDTNTQATCTTLWDISDSCPVKRFEKDIGCVLKSIFNGDGNKLLTISTKDESALLTIWDTTNLNNIRVVKEVLRSTNDVFHDISCSSDGKVWVVTTVGGSLLFLYNTGINWTICEHQLFHPSQGSLEYTKVVYSPDNEFVAALAPRQKNLPPRVLLWSTVMREAVTTVFAWGKSVSGIGFTPDSNQLVFVGSDGFYKRLLLGEADEKTLAHLFYQTSVHQLSVLRRLYQACKNKDTITLYEQEPAYKTLQALPHAPHNCLDFIQEHLPYKVIHNNEDDLRGDSPDCWK